MAKVRPSIAAPARARNRNLPVGPLAPSTGREHIKGSDFPITTVGGESSVWPSFIGPRLPPLPMMIEDRSTVAVKSGDEPDES